MWYENSLGLGAIQISTSVSNSELYSYGYCSAFQFSPLASKSHRRESLRQHTTSTSTCSCHNDKSSFSQRRRRCSNGVCVEVANQQTPRNSRQGTIKDSDRPTSFPSAVLCVWRIEPATDCPPADSHRGVCCSTQTIARRLWPARIDGGVATMAAC
jgi:hypothetical protein